MRSRHSLGPEAALIFACALLASVFSVRASTRPLSFEERVAAQRAIEDVYWRHRIWPAENRTPKPPLSRVMPDAAIRARVEDTLRKSGALEAFWGRPVTGEQLQAELDRIARDTQDPGMLREIYAALGNDAFLAAETLARGSLADRLIRNWYAFDPRFHGDLKARAQTALAARRDNAVLEGDYSRTTYRRVDGTLGDAPPAAAAQDRRGDVMLDPGEWSEWRSSLAGRFGVASTEIPVGEYSALQEDADRFFTTAVLSREDDAVTVATVSWAKRPFDLWWSGETGGLGLEVQAGAFDFVLESPAGQGCVDDTWERRWHGPAPRSGHAAIWTGAEMIIWGGPRTTTGARYNPATDTWAPTSTGADMPYGRRDQTAVWTGTEMIVWGGDSTNTGGRYSPATDAWVKTSTSAGVPTGRSGHTAIWTGTEMIVWGGYHDEFYCCDDDGGRDSYRQYPNQGGRYDPVTDSWTPTSTGPGVPQARSSHTAVWTGTEMIIWGGFGDLYASPGGYVRNTGGRYNPASDTWIPTSVGAGVPSPRTGHTAVWTGTEMIIWGGYQDQFTGALIGTGGRYSPATNSWIPTSIGAGTPSGRSGHTAIWTGGEMIVWGGSTIIGGPSRVNTGARYDPQTDSWIPTNISGWVPSGRTGHTAVWTGTEMIVWGGDNSNTGGRYSPANDDWVPTASAKPPIPLVSWQAKTVWTGAEMIVWGGQYGNDQSSRYDPALDRWTPISASAGAPVARSEHTAIWTGTEMIVWGGGFDVVDQYHNISRAFLDTGGRYDPTMDSWKPTSISAETPSRRSGHTAIWTGSEMIVWGGADEASTYWSAGGYYYTHGADDGARYDPASDTWVPTSALGGLAAGRYNHTAIWTGSEMIVWGGLWVYLDEWDGFPYYFLLDTGGRYDPLTDAWTPTSTGAGVPPARERHTAVWTGATMIVWGGWDSLGPGSGGRYSPSTDAWTPTSTGSGVPSSRLYHTAVWTGAEMIVWGGRLLMGNWQGTNTGGRYDPLADSWTSTSVGADAPQPDSSHVAVWTGDRLIVWSGVPEPEVRLYCALHNRPPVADAGIDRTVECEAAGRASVTLDGSASSDPDSTPGTHDAIVDYEWLEGWGSPSETLLGEGETLTTTLSLGVHAITLRVTDAGGATATASLNVVVEDTIPPSLVVALDPVMLWPPDHGMRAVHVEARATDACDPSPAVVLSSVSSSEPDDAPDPGGAVTMDDIQGALVGAADFDILLRAERSGKGDGRIYTLRYEARDASGCAASAATIVTVPHDARGTSGKVLPAEREGGLPR